jgi:polar amino acid transport system substrate-binding protein
MIWQKVVQGLLGILVSAGSAMVQAQCTRMVVTADPAYPPLHWFDGDTLQGASIEIAKRVLTDLRIDFEIRTVGPFPRVLALAERGEVDMVVTLKKTPEREAFLLYPKTIALHNPVAVFTTRELPLVYRDKTDLIGLRGTMARGNAFGNGVDEFIKDKLNVQEVNRPDAAFGLMLMGRTDYFITGYYTGMALLWKRGDDMQFVAKEPFLVDTPNYLALTRHGKCADKLEQIETRLAALKRAGVLDDIVRASIQRWRQHPVMVDR